MTKVIKREHAERAQAHESVLAVPEVMRTAPGIAIQGRKIRSLVFSTDLAVICHCDADAVIADICPHANNVHSSNERS